MSQSYQAAIIIVRHRDYIDLELMALKPVLGLPILVNGRRVKNEKRFKIHGLTYL